MTTKCKKSQPVSASPTSGYGAGYSGVTAMAVEAPPLPPVVNIIPYAHINNKMLFLFQKKEVLLLVFLFMFFIFKMARKRAHEVRTAITSNLPLVSRSDLFSEYDSCGNA